jgi:hypothetical protein
MFGEQLYFKKMVDKTYFCDFDLSSDEIDYLNNIISRRTKSIAQICDENSNLPKLIWFNGEKEYFIAKISGLDAQWSLCYIRYGKINELNWSNFEIALRNLRATVDFNL